MSIETNAIKFAVLESFFGLDGILFCVFGLSLCGFGLLFGQFGLLLGSVCNPAQFPKLFEILSSIFQMSFYKAIVVGICGNAVHEPLVKVSIYAYSSIATNIHSSHLLSAAIVTRQKV